MSENRIPLSRALVSILLSTLLISGSAFMGWLYYLHVKEIRQNDDQYRIVAILQSTPQADALKTGYLAELLSLSLDKSANLYQFSVKKGIQTLLGQPLIKSVSIKKIPPGTIYIDYQMRTPIAYLGDYGNTVIDEEGYLFPFRPFFTPKRLPAFYLGLDKDECRWGKCLSDHPSLQLAFSLLDHFRQLKQEKLRVMQVDVSQADADSYGQRQAVLVLQNGQPHSPCSLIYLRISLDHYDQALANFNVLQGHLLEKEKQPLIIDHRIPHLAFIKRLK